MALGGQTVVTSRKESPDVLVLSLGGIGEI
jgi:hypothetical protein